MQHAIITVAATVVLLGCGPKPAADVNEPTQDQDEATGGQEEPGSDEDAAVSGEADEEMAPGEPEPDDDGEETQPKEIVGSAKQDEIVPIQEKEYNVDFGVEFHKGPDAQGKQGVLANVGEAGLQITMCYRKLVLDDDDMQGDMAVTMKILPGGVAKVVKVVENTTGSKKLATCTVKELKKKKYPKKLAGKKPATVTVTLEFRPFLK